MKTLVIGDIHGCFDELMELLDRAGLSPDDEVISLGDLVDRGPATPAVLKFFSTAPRARALMGNHERKHVRSFKGQTSPSLSQRITRHQLGEDHYPAAVAWMAGLPTSVELPDSLLVHAMFEPGVPLQQQRETVIVGTLSGEHRLRERYSRPWHELYDGSVPIVVGHHNIGGGSTPYVRADGRVIGLDTSCYAGGALSALLLPEFKLLSVPSRANHWGAVRAKHAGLEEPQAEVDNMPFDRIESTLANWWSSSIDESLPMRLRQMRCVIAKVDTTASEVMAMLVADHEQIEASLAAVNAGVDLTERESSGRYAEAIGRRQHGPLLHALRRGRLDVNSLKARLRTPRALFQLHALLARGS